LLVAQTTVEEFSRFGVIAAHRSCAFACPQRMRSSTVAAR
jgi:hypothetical protein